MALSRRQVVCRIRCVIASHGSAPLRTLASCSLLLAAAWALAEDAPPAAPETANPPPTSDAHSEQTSGSQDAKGIEFFESKIRPVLVKNCYGCHSGEAGKSEGGLFLDSRAGVRRGGDSGPAVVPGDPAQSLLLTAVSHTDPNLTMPPRGQPLSPQVVADIRAWIAAGAPDPRVSETAAVASTVDLEAGREFWSLQKPVDSDPPTVHDTSWARRPLDNFVLAKLEQAGMAPAPDAAPATLLRRLYFDLVGLPPAPADLERFLHGIESRGFEEALAAEADSLLASPQFGERWGRHWLDVARYAESSGKEANISFPYAWRYRDYVIDCVTADVPYDRFLVEQIAGDLLPYDSDAERARLLIATGFLAIGPKNLDEGNKAQFAADIVDEQIDALSRAVLASSIACARCHDHKFDPYRMEDYYALAGIFASTKTCFGTAVSPANQVGGDPLPLPRVEGQQIFHKSMPAEKVAELREELATLRGENKPQMQALKKKAMDAQEMAAVEFDIREILRVFWRSGAIEGELEKVDDRGQALPLAMGALDRESVADAPLLDRGEVAKPGREIPRGVPAVFNFTASPELPEDQSGRLELARWLTHPDHPLTARVMVNRVWRHLFGAGIVRTVDNFGTSGELPSHPELLDHLAVQFVAEGWSVKALVRELALSRAYRQASTFDPEAFQRDPENRLLWRMSKRRLDAEAIRDAMLAASGDLDLARPAGSLVGRVIGDRPIALIGLDKRLPADLDGATHRSVYLPVIRDRLPDVLDLFDFAEPSLVTGDRETTNVPIQALYLMNSPFVQARAESLARRLEREASTDADRIELAFRLCYSRAPSAEERDACLEYLGSAGNRESAATPDRATVMASFCQALLATAEFRNVD